jgi:hypothetical protein
VYFNIRNILPKSGTFLLGHSVYGFCYRRKVERKIRTIEDTMSRAFRVTQQYKLAMNGFKSSKLFPVKLYVFTDSKFTPWVVTNQPEINLNIKSFEPVSAWWTGPTKGSKYQKKAFGKKRFKWNLHFLHVSPKRGATLNLCNRMEGNVFTFPWNKCPLTPVKTPMSHYRKVPSCTWIFSS